MAKTPEQILRDISLSGGAGVMCPDGSVETRVGPDWVVPLVYPTKRPISYPGKPEKESPMDEDDVVETKKIKAALLEKPVENNGPVPLIPNLDANARHVITQIRVIKRTPPNDGIKGEVDSTTTMDFIGRRWGDGIYDFEALNEAGQCLRRNTNVKISYGYQPAMEQSQSIPAFQKFMAGASSDTGMQEKLLERLDSVSDRAHKASEMALQSTQKLSQDYASMIREDSKDRSEKDRSYHKAQSEQQTNFFQSMLMSMQTMHEQSMERSREQFQQTMQMMQFSHQQTLQQNNPALLFQLFERGLKFGAEANGGEDESPLTSILGAATQGLSTVKDMMLLQQPQQSAILPASAPVSAPVARKNPEKKPLLSKEQVAEVLRLKKIALSRGLDFDGLLKQAQTMVANMPAEEPEHEEDEDSDSESDGSPDVD